MPDELTLFDTDARMLARREYRVALRRVTCPTIGGRMPDLPPAIQFILPELAADAGRGRAVTLLSILGAGPDYLRTHLTDIDAALGVDSPGAAGLEDLIASAEEAVSTSQPTVKHQHVISQVVLRKYVEEVPPGGRQLARFDVSTGVPRLDGTNGVGYVDDFVPADSKATEDLWQQVEGVLNEAIAAASAGSALSDPKHHEALRRVVALHFVRNPRTLSIHNSSFAAALQQTTDRWASTPFAAEAFRRHYKLEPAGPEALRLGAEAAQGRLVKLHREGGLFRLSVQRLYENVCDRFDAKGVLLLRPTSPSKEFLLGDAVAITVNKTTGAAGLAAGVAIYQADEIRMPVAPDLTVVVGPPDGVCTLADEEVAEFNRLQSRLAAEYIIYRPSAGACAAEIPVWRL